MNIITHALIGWCAGNRFSRNINEVAVIAAASVVPDIDGFGAVADMVRGGEAELFLQFHHKFGHCLTFCLAMVAVVYLWRKNARIALWCAGIFHLHLLGDIIGARGPDGYQWPVYYFYRFCEAGITWSGQLEINAWPNLVLTMLLVLVFLYQSARSGFSPIRFLSVSADEQFVATLQKRLAIKTEQENGID